MEKNEGNKAITEYMGKKWIQHPHYVNIDYSCDWNDLMPVVEKIGKHVYDDVIEGEEPDTAFMRTFHSNMARINRFPLHQAETQIQAVWEAVVEFIDFLNTDMK